MTEIKKPLKTKLPAEVYYQEVNIRNFKQVYNAKAKMEAADYNMYFNPSYDFVYLVYFIFNLNTFYYIILRILTLLYGAVSSAARRSTVSPVAMTHTHTYSHRPNTEEIFFYF